MFCAVLIANRGEIACRIVRTAKRLGLRSIAVYSTADRKALHVKLADEAVEIGPAPAAESYLSIDRVIAAAQAVGADCIHPGYGFLAENAEFAQACLDAGFAFIGPPPAVIGAVGLKDNAKAKMEAAGLPVVPGYQGERQEPKFLKQKAWELGYPLLIKPVAGGGGKGMRRVERHADFDAALESACREAQAAFGDARVLVEKYVNRPRHVEMQIFADRHGHVIHLGERDCSLQRRHQKVIEEAPAPGMSDDLRARMGAAAVAAAKAVGYEGAGTVEFIADGTDGLRADRFWFVEMNTRLQVEHPVTEAVTGLDLVEWQFLVAAGETLPLKQDQVRLTGHAVEARLYAEDPESGFLPSTGKLIALQFPEAKGLRVDVGAVTGDTITPFYDPMIAKLIAKGTARIEAVDRLAEALEGTIIAGPHTNAGFLAALCRAPAFRKEDFDTGFIDAHLAALGAGHHEIDRAAAALGVQLLLAQERARISAACKPDEPPSPWDAVDCFQLTGARRLKLPVIADGKSMIAEVTYGPKGAMVAIDGSAPVSDAVALAAGGLVYVLRRGRQTKVSLRELALDEARDHEQGGLVHSPMHGKILEILVTLGAAVERGQPLAVIEAMKMEHTLTAPIEGVVVEIVVEPDAQVAEGAKVIVIEPREQLG